MFCEEKQEIFEEILNSLPKFNNLKAVYSDFCLAQINAIKKVYPSGQVASILYNDPFLG